MHKFKLVMMMALGVAMMIGGSGKSWADQIPPPPFPGAITGTIGMLIFTQTADGDIAHIDNLSGITLIDPAIAVTYSDGSVGDFWLSCVLTVYPNCPTNVGPAITETPYHTGWVYLVSIPDGLSISDVEVFNSNPRETEFVGAYYGIDRYEPFPNLSYPYYNLVSGYFGGGDDLASGIPIQAYFAQAPMTAPEPPSLAMLAAGLLSIIGLKLEQRRSTN